MFKFDHIFKDNVNQESVFAISALHLVDEVLKGFNTAFLAYGQSGSGKTCTFNNFFFIFS